MQQAERAIFDLRRGHPVFLQETAADGAVIAAVETMTDVQAEELRELGGGPLRLVLSARRAEALGLPPVDPDAPAVCVELPETVTAEQILALVCGEDIMPPEELGHMNVSDAAGLETVAVDLTRSARLLPAVLAVRARTDSEAPLAEQLRSQSVLTVPLREAQRLISTPRLRMSWISTAEVPLEDAGHTRFVLFRESNGMLEHVAILIGHQDQWPDPVPVRVHSACLTGDLFGSLRCDCGEQLRRSVRMIREAGGGVLLYMAQEGRGIGLANKLRAYTLQSSGLDTVDADRVLGFRDDERRYDSAVFMLQELGVDRIALFTNNPEKVRALETGGIQVLERRAMHGRVHDHNRGYLRTKAARAGHMLEDLLDETDRDEEPPGRSS
ncbi:GTP cyclohydrolase II RibA [Methylonatrum kenyense]|uniref:GTP cyclohydrolase II RibA n=1 Tax=Methylonatrum kenyense TaxID=455253 RepID=UPI0020BF0236|nr:GTP cyclohydrolase II RibA [Methylonatrum kenyense]MCK8515725.1 GTP cyclohydrolase II RibA [Methylonatrum kenyense]